MPSPPPDERSPRKNAPAKATVPALIAPSAGAPLPSSGGKAPAPTRFTPKYVPRLLAYDLPEYQEEQWRQ